MHYRILFALSFTLSLSSWCVPLRAQWAVVDIDAIAGITKQVSQGAQQIQQLQAQYNQMKAMAQQAQGLFRYRGPQNVFQAISYADQYATLADWAAGGASGNANMIQQGYAKNTVLANVDQSLSSINAGVARTRSAMYATQSVMDGNNLAAMQAVGQIRAAATQYKNAIDQLENDSEDPDPDVQSALAVAQRTATANVLQLRAQQDTNNLLTQIALQQVAQSKMTRDALADSTNRTLEQQTSDQAIHQLDTGMGDSWMNFRVLPWH